MERLTVRLKNGVLKEAPITDGNRGESIMSRLAAYEDTGLTPEELTPAIRSVLDERKRQDEKWGDQSSNHPFEWISILGEEYGEMCEAVNETCFQNGDKPERGGFEKIRREATHVAAVAVAFLEAIDKGAYDVGLQEAEEGKNDANG